jgi:hypothetical protein
LTEALTGGNFEDLQQGEDSNYSHLEKENRRKGNTENRILKLYDTT